MRPTSSLFLNIVISLFCGCLFLLGLDATRALTQIMPNTAASHFELKAGSSLTGMSKELHKQGLLAYQRDARYLSLFGRLSGMSSQLQSGEYAIAEGTSPLQLLQAMVKGDVVEYSLTIVEGWNVKQILAALKAHPHIKQSESDITPAFLAKEFNLKESNPEGWIYPDTYNFPKHTTAISLLRRSYAAMRSVLDEEWGQRAADLPYKSAYEALIMASIIEKETGVVEERGQIAGVFVRRLRKGMRLQTDPTVIYGIGPEYDGNIRRRDLLKPTPYNTYTQFGLPPTPIASPGRAAIHAALHPEPGESLYFVSKGDGSHQFSATLAEHNKAVRKYQLGKTEKQAESK